MNYVFIIFALFVLVAIYLNVVSTVTVLRTDVIEKTQRIAQIMIVWLIPFVGSLFVLHIVAGADPECLESKWLIWPFRSIVFGKKIRTSSIPEDDYWVMEKGGSHRGGREMESNHIEPGGSD